ncbi:MAG: endonuclease domain-containing protein [Chitinophagales bacterium]
MPEKLFFNSSENIVNNAKELRQRQTETEEKLWSFLRNRNLKGYKFRRQHYIGTYIVDFYCAEKMLSIELDGGIHNSKEQKEYDQTRTIFLTAHGIKELRFSNEEVLKDMTAVLCKIENELNNRK